jgi:hypothetical protein
MPVSAGKEGTMTATEATAQGFHPLAGPFTAAEGKLRDAVIADLKRGGIAYKLVSEIGGTSVWRAGWVGTPRRALTNKPKLIPRTY